MYPARYTRLAMRASTASLLLSALVMGALAAACAPTGGEPIASGEQPSTADDLATAKEVVATLGGSQGKCKMCHGVNEAKMRAWGTQMKALDAACFASELSPKARIDCFRSDPQTPTSPFSAKRLGLYAAAVPLEPFKAAFQAAYPDTWQQEFAAFSQKTAMPRSGAPLTSAELAKMKSWVLRGMPQLAQAFGAPPDPEPLSCTPSLSPELEAHVTAMKTTGWGARLADQATPMLGCEDAAHPLRCLTQLPDATATFGAPNVAQTLRQIHAQDLTSHYWVRSSADGRYVGFGMNDSAKIVDLKLKKRIAVEADYDPYFLPSNDGFAFAGAHADQAIHVCRQSLLADTDHVSLTESKCASMGKEVYMSIGTALDSSRYYLTYGEHENDDGGHDITEQLAADFGPTAATTFVPMVNDGLSYKAQQSVRVSLPNEGDMMLSPSSKLAVTRFGENGRSLGYRIRMVKPSISPATLGATMDLPLAGTLCLPGQKANFSFDERFVVTHQYVDRTQPDQATLPAGSANVVLADLVTGKVVRLFLLPLI